MTGSKPARKIKPTPRGASAVPSLAELQALMLAAVRRPLTADEGSQAAWSDGTPTARVAEGFIKPNDRLTSFERLQIYNQQYWWRLLGAFAEDFRGLRAVLGEKKFDRVAHAYLESCPSKSWTLRNLASRLVDFLAAHPELTAPYSALALDMARVEWARVIAYDGPARKPLDVQKLGQSDPGGLRLRLQPYITLLELHHPIDVLLRRLKQQNDAGPASNAMSAAPAQRRRPFRLQARASRQPLYLAVHQLDCSVYYKRLEPEAWRILSAIARGASLEEACAAGFTGDAAAVGEGMAKVQGWFADWASFGWLTK
jgi:hypothetical protein